MSYDTAWIAHHRNGRHNIKNDQDTEQCVTTYALLLGCHLFVVLQKISQGLFVELIVKRLQPRCLCVVFLDWVPNSIKMN